MSFYHHNCSGRLCHLPNAISGFVPQLYAHRPVPALACTMNNPWFSCETGEYGLRVNDGCTTVKIVEADLGKGFTDQEGIGFRKPVRMKVTQGILPECFHRIPGYGHRAFCMKKGLDRQVSDLVLLTQRSKESVRGVRAMRLVNLTGLIKARVAARG